MILYTIGLGITGYCYYYYKSSISNLTVDYVDKCAKKRIKFWFPDYEIGELIEK